MTRSKIIKSTNKELVEELTARNLNGKYDQLIKNAVSNLYHDYKNPPDVVCGKMLLAADLSSFPELDDIYYKVLDGEYDEVADEDDKAAMRAELPKYMWEAMGLNPNETEENNSLTDKQQADEKDQTNN
jgi:hypothetical protein